MTLVDDVRRQITERLKELKPLVDEYHQLEAMVKKLVEDGSSSSSTARRSSGRRRAATRSTNGRRRGRPRGSGTRSAQALALVQAKPGITIPEMGKEMGITPNYLYRVLPELAKDGKVKKSGKGWVPA
jgi:CRP-like cAMP-binding protein